MKYFVRANTCTGEVNFLSNNLNGIEKIYLIQSEFEFLVSTFIMRLCAHVKLQNDEIEMIYNPFIMNNLDGFVIRSKKIAVLNSGLMTANNRCILIDIDSCIKKKRYAYNLACASDYKAEVLQKKQCIYMVYEGAKKIHDEWENLYIENMNFDMLNGFCNDFINGFNVEKTNKTSSRCDRFFGGAFHSANINYIDDLTKDIKNRYFIKGRPGTGKSTFLKKLANHFENSGYNVEVYHCGFDSNSLDMVVCRELSVCVFDSTSPHEKFPSLTNDSILDFYKNSGLEGVDEKLEAKLNDVKLRYGKMMSLSKIYMEEIHDLYKKFESKTVADTDYQLLNNIVYEILYEII